MPIPIPCPSCGAVWPATEELLGRAVKCPGCRYPLPVPDPPTQEFQEREFRHHVGAALTAVVGFGALLAIGAYCAFKANYVGAGLAGVPALIGLALNGRKLIDLGPVLLLTKEGIVSGSEGKQTCLPWQAVQSVRLEIKREPTHDTVIVETLWVSFEESSGQVTEKAFDVKGLDLDSQGIARLVMREVIRFNPRVLVQLRETMTGLDTIGLRLFPPD